jgi:muramidase (phage lysozyme)
MENPIIAELLPKLNEPNVRSFLDMISAAEGTTKHGYNTLFGGGKFENLQDHPRQLFDFTETTGRKNKTSAAGRYQFLSNTWDEQAKKLGLPDFGERSQDLAALNLLRERGILPDVMQGNWDTAVKKSGPIWASLPSSPYPQPRQSEAFVMGQLNNPRNQVASGPVTSDANPIAMPNQRANPFSALNEEFRIGAPVQQQQQTRNPFEELNAEFALRPVESTVAPVTAAPQQNQPFSINQLLRPVGLTARAGLEGVGAALSAPTEPIRMATEAVSRLAGGPSVASAETMGQRLANLMGLPKPKEKSVMDNSGQAERFGFDVAKTGFSALPIVAGARAAAPFTGGNSQAILNQLSANPALQGISAAGAGAGGSIAREYGAPPELEMLASIAGGIAAPMAAAPIGSGIKSAVTAAGSKIAPTRFGVQPEQVDKIITNTLGKSGFDFSKVPEQVKTALRNDVANALRTGGTFDEAAMSRLIDIRMIEGATPTKGMISLDPRQVTLEQNLAKAGMNSTNSDLQQLGQIQNANNQALINALNQRGAGDVRSPYLMQAGEANVGKISAMDAAKQAATSSLYKAAEDTAGGTIPLDRSTLINNIDTALSAKNKAAFLPKEIRDTLNTIAKGEVTIEGKTFAVPFDVNALDNLMTTIATASRSTKDGNVIGALKIVRDAIDKTELKPIKADLGGGLVTAETGAALRAADAQPKELLDALNKARASHRERMAWIESSKPINATVDGMQPDQFIRKFVLSGDVADAAAVAKSGDPAATKTAILTYLKDKALGGQSDELGTFGAKTYNQTIKDIGDKKLELFFSPDEIAELKRLGRAASYMTTQPKGSAVNNSNSGALVIGAGIDAIGAMGGLPLVGTVVGATVAAPLAKAGAKKLFGSAASKSDQKEALNLANALATKVPGMALGEKITSGALYGSLLQNPQLMQQLDQRLRQLTE